MIGTVKIDFTIIPDSSPDILIVGDMSTWAVAENKQSTILITPPGSTKAISNTFMKHKLNIFNSENLGLSCPQEKEHTITPTFRTGYGQSIYNPHWRD
jgi:hypothetical protein